MPTAKDHQTYFTSLGLCLQKPRSSTDGRFEWVLSPASIPAGAHSGLRATLHFPTLNALDTWWRYRTSALVVANATMHQLHSTCKDLSPDALDAIVQWLTKPNLMTLGREPRPDHVPEWLHEAVTEIRYWETASWRDVRRLRQPLTVSLREWRRVALRLFKVTHVVGTLYQHTSFPRRARRLCTRAGKERLRNLPAALHSTRARERL